MRHNNTWRNQIAQVRRREIVSVKDIEAGWVRRYDMTTQPLCRSVATAAAAPATPAGEAHRYILEHQLPTREKWPCFFPPLICYRDRRYAEINWSSVAASAVYSSTFAPCVCVSLVRTLLWDMLYVTSRGEMGNLQNETVVSMSSSFSFRGVFSARRDSSSLRTCTPSASNRGGKTVNRGCHTQYWYLVPTFIEPRNRLDICSLPPHLFLLVESPIYH